MSEKTEFIGGPIHGRKRPLAGMADVVGIPLNANLEYEQSGEAFAFALYQRSEGNGEIVYRFGSMQRADKKDFDVEFADGPCRGRRPLSQPPHYCEKEVRVPLSSDGNVAKDEAEVASVAIYRSKATGTQWRFHLDRIENSAEVLKEVRAKDDEDRAIAAMKNFYLSPNYSIYSIPPTGEHPQVLVRHEHRKAHVDEKIAPLIEALWRLNLDTLGSCQQRPSGMAYVSFPVARHGTVLHERLVAAGIEATIEQKGFSVKNASTGQVVELESVHVKFSPDDIPRIVEALAVGPNART